MSLTKNELAALSKLLDQALDLPESDRDTWLEQLDAQHASLRPTLRELLTRHANVETDDFLKTLPKFVSALAAAKSDSTLQSDAVIGGYRLIREVGHGGMSSVWLAERVDGAMKRSVALKLPFVQTHRPEFAERFIRERDILSGLTHPNIARLYDAGVSPLGQPYLAMEYIEGVPLIEHCDVDQLNIRQRLELFRQVLAAVQYAHSQLVIHRDLKPSNILVTAQHQVALLDFGIAKLTIDGEAKETELTQLGGRALTLNYASPEQIAGQTLSTASDIYSLGVVLYELLTGVLPYKIKRDSRGALEDAILSVDPLKPSQALTASSVKQPMKLLRGDLDTIVLKALSKSPNARYATAQAFDDDLRRHLVGEPVLAQPDRFIYRAGKFLARNKLAVGATGAILVAALAAAGVSLWQARLAEHEARKATAVQDVLLDLFKANTDAQDNPIAARDLTARQLLDIEASRVGENLKDHPEIQEAVLGTLQSMYYDVGLDDQAAAMSLRRIDAIKRAYGDTDVRVADAMLDYAGDIYNISGYAQALPVLKDVKSILDANGDYTSKIRGFLLAEDSRLNLFLRPRYAQQVGDQAVEFLNRYYPHDELLQTAMSSAARAHFMLGDYVGAEERNDASTREANRMRPPSMSGVLNGQLVAADIERESGRVVQAEAHLRETLRMSRSRNGDLHIDTLHVRARLGALLHATSRRAEGREILATAVQDLSSGRVPDNGTLASIVYHNWGWSLFTDGRVDEAEKFLAGNLERKQRMYPESTAESVALRELAEFHVAVGKYDVARDELDRAIKLWMRATEGSADPAMTNPIVFAQARLAIARTESIQALEILTRIAMPNNSARALFDVDSIAMKLITAQSNLQQRNANDAFAAAQQALAYIQSSDLHGYYQALEANALLYAGQSQSLLGDRKNAERNLRSALSLLIANDDSISPAIAEAQIALANCLFDSGNKTQAIALLAKAKAIHAAHKELGEHFKRPLRELQLRLEKRSA